MALLLHEKDLNAMGASLLPQRRLHGKPAPQEISSYSTKLLRSNVGILNSASSCMRASNSYGAPSEMVVAEVQSGNSPAPPPAGPARAHLQSVEDMLMHLKQNKLTEGRPIKTQPQRTATPSDNMCLVGENSGRIKWIQPSGPRRSGEGTEDEEQGIIAAESTVTGGAMVRITLLAAGFVIGPSGSSVREISKQTGADIKSWTEKPDDKSPSSHPRPTRSFVIEGKKRAVVLALDIMCDAVDRYKELCEGRYCGQCVARIQKVRGVEFSYQPPPRNIVPYAAALKGQHPRGNRAEVPPAVVPTSHVPAAAAINYSTVRPASDNISLSTQGTDSCSDMGDDHHTNALSDDKKAVHSKAQVMQSYLSAQESARAPTDYPKHPSSNSVAAMYGSQDSTHPTSPNFHDTPASNAASITASKPSSKGSRVYTTPHPTQSSQGGQGGQSPFAGGASPGVGPFGSTPKGVASVSMAASAKPMDLVQIKPNVWLPLAAVQQAGGDLDLALHLAAQGVISTDTDIADSNPPAHDALGVEGSSKKKYDGSFLYTHSAGDSKHHGQQHEFVHKHSAQTSSVTNTKAYNMGSDWIPSSHTRTGSSSTNHDGRASMGGSCFDPIIQPPAFHMSAKLDVTAPHTASVNRNSSAFSFKSPTVSLPYMSSTSPYISPQCLMDNSSMFSYNIATPEQVAYTRPAPWYATPEVTAPQGWGHAPTSGGSPNAACYYPELNPSAAKHMSEVYGFGSGGQSVLLHTPYAGGPYWQDPVIRQLLPEYGASSSMQIPHSNMASAMGSNDPSSHQAGVSPLPWIQGGHPLLDKF